MRTLAAQVRGCTARDGMNIPAVTQSAPGYGSVRSPVVIVGQSLCGPCMASQIPFTGGSGRFLDRSLTIAGVAKEDVFTTTPGVPRQINGRPSTPTVGPPSERWAVITAVDVYSAVKVGYRPESTGLDEQHNTLRYVVAQAQTGHNRNCPDLAIDNP
jgi:hypothetical protein